MTDDNGSQLNPVLAMRAQLVANEMMTNALVSRKDLLRKLLDPRRDIDDECGYPKTVQITSLMYRNLYDRESVATRVVEVLPAETWKTHPTVFETEDAESTTNFEESWSDLPRQLTEESWYQDAVANPIWEILRRADILCGIGHYGVILLGFDDGQSLDRPVRPDPERKLLFVRAFDESIAKIVQWDTNRRSPRYMQPTSYQLSFSDPRDEGSHEGIGIQWNDEPVHWSRIIHIADNKGSSEVFGVPRMRPVYNRINDLRKLYAGSAEMYWRGAFPGVSIEIDPNAAIEGLTAAEKQSFKDETENYMNTLQRYMILSGASAKSLAPQVVAPNPQIDAQITALCVLLGVPKRIFMGSERGELSSTQDDSTWNDRIRDRQINFVTPKILVPFIDRLIRAGVLPEPDGFSVVWPDLNALTHAEQADVAVKRTNAAAKYVQGNVEAVIQPLDFLIRFLGFSRSEAEAMLEATMSTSIEDSLTPSLGEPEPVENPTLTKEEEAELGNAPVETEMPRMRQRTGSAP